MKYHIMAYNGQFYSQVITANSIGEAVYLFLENFSNVSENQIYRIERIVVN